MADDKNKNAADKAAKEAEAKAQKQAAEAEKAKAAQEKARRDAEAKAKAEQEKAKAQQEKAAKEAQAKAQKQAAEAEKAKAAQEKARRDAEAKAKAEQEKAKAQQEKAARAAQAKAAKEAEAKAAKEAEVKASKEAQAQAKAPDSDKAKAAQAQATQAKAAQEAQAKAQKQAAAKKKSPKQLAKEKKQAEKAAKIIAEGGPLPEGSATGKVKLTRKQKKALLERQKQREKELVEAGEIPLRRRYKPRGLFWRILGVSLAFFMGIFATVGALVGGGVILLTRKSGDVIDFVLDFTGSELKSSDILTDAYLDKTLSELLHDAQTDILDPLIADPGNLTLKTLANFTPMVDTYLNDLAAEYLDDLGITLDLEELKEQKLADFVSYAKSSILPKMELGPLLELDVDVSLDKIDDNAPMYALCYGKYGTDYTIEDNTIKMLEGKSPKNITDFVPSLKADDSGVSPTAATSDDDTEGLMSVLGDIELGTFLGLDIQRPSEASDNNAMLYAMCYGTEGVDFEFVSVSGSTAKVLHPLSTKAPTTVEKLMNNTNEFINDLSLGSLLGLEDEENLASRADNMMMYTLCYGTEDVDWKVEGGKIVMLGDKKPLSIGKLTAESNEVMDDLPLGDMLGLNTKEELDNRENNSLMYALCYGKYGEDYTIEDDKIVMLGDKVATTLGKLSHESQDVVNSLNVDDILDVSANSDAIVRVVAYGNEMAKDADGNYLVDEDGKYLTEHVKKVVTDPDTGAEQEVMTEQYVGGGRYVIEGEGDAAKIVMLPDPNDPNGKLYDKKTIGDLTDEDADLLDGITLGSIMGVDSSSSGIMKAMKDWTIDDLNDQNKIEGLFLGDVLELDRDESAERPEGTSQIMWTLRNKTISDLNKQDTINELHLNEVLEIDPDNSSNILVALGDKQLQDLGNQDTIDNLRLNEVLDIDAESSGIMKAMADWKLGDLSQQTRIERLKIKQIITIDSDATGIMKAMQDWRISDLNDQDKIDSLTLGDVITIDATKDTTPQMLIALKNKTLGEISESIDTLTLEEALGDEAFKTGNKILNALRYKQIKELGGAIDELTVEDVFGDDIWSYAKGFKADERPTQTLTAEQVAPFYYHGTRDNVLTGGWYEGNDTDGYKLIVGEEVTAERYVERRVYLTRTASYYEVNYDNLSDTSKTYTDDVKEDDYGFYYEDAEGNRVDLEVEYTYTLQDSAGPAPGGVRIQEEEVDGTVQFYYTVQVDVTYRYADRTGTTYAENDETNVKKGYTETTSDEEVTAYHAGVWYLLLVGVDGQGAEKDLSKTHITEMAELVTGVTDKLNNITLGDMYVHELIDTDPTCPLDGLPTNMTGGNTDLNQLKISQVIDLVKALVEAYPGN